MRQGRFAILFICVLSFLPHCGGGSDDSSSSGISTNKKKKKKAKAKENEEEEVASRDLKLALSFKDTNEDFANALALLKNEDYEIANSQLDIPNAKSNFSNAQPESLNLSGLSLASLGLSSECTALEVPSAIDSLDEGTYSALKSALLDIWDRFYDGCGPTDIPSSLEGIDETLASMEASVGEGEFRCLVSEPKDFTMVHGDISDLSGALTVPLSCTEEVATSLHETTYRRTYGVDDDYWYFWEIGIGGELLKIAKDGDDMTAIGSFGLPDNSSQSQGTRYIRTRAVDGISYFFMTTVGDNIGDGGCGSMIMSKTDPDADSNYIYYYLKGDPDAGDCSSVTAKEYCLDSETFLPANTSDVTDFALCESNKITRTTYSDSPLSDAPIFDYSEFAVSGSETVFGPTTEYLESASADGEYTLDDLYSHRTQDPLLVVKNRLLNSGPSSLESMSVRYDKAVADVIRLATVNEKPAACLYNKPQKFDVTTPFDMKFPMYLNCKATDNDFAFGYVNSTYYSFEKGTVDDDADAVWVKSHANGDGELWRVMANSSTATEWGETGGIIMHIKFNQAQKRYEAVFAGAPKGAWELGCGTHVVFQNNYIYSKGKFAADSCDGAFLDEDCIEKKDGELLRRDVSVCHNVPGVSDFELSELTQAEFNPKKLYDLAKVSASSDLMKREAPVDNSAEEPPLVKEIGTLKGKVGPVAVLPLTAAANAFVEDSGQLGALTNHCELKAGVAATKTYAAQYSLSFKNFNAEQLAALNDAVTKFKSFVGYQVSVDVFKRNDPVVAHSLKVAVNYEKAGAVLKSLSFDDHSTSSPFMVQGVISEPVTVDHSIKIIVTGEGSVTCPDSTDRQGMVRVGMHDVNLFY